MNRNTPLYLSTYLMVALGAFLGSASGQNLSEKTMPVAYDSAFGLQRAEPVVGQIHASDPYVRRTATVSGRVFNDAEKSEVLGPVHPKGIAGVKIILRSVDADGTIISNQMSDAAGTYTFPNVAPGNYTIEVDPVGIPAMYRLPIFKALSVSVWGAANSRVDVPITAKRHISGTVFIDKDGDGRYKPGKDEPVNGAQVTVDGLLTVTDANGRYILRDLPGGRIGMLVSSPNDAPKTHVVFDIGSAPVIDRVVNIPVSR